MESAIVIDDGSDRSGSGEYMHHFVSEPFSETRRWVHYRSDEYVSPNREISQLSTDIPICPSCPEILSLGWR